MIETVVVDLGGVVAHFQPERRLEALAALSGVSAGVIQERLFDSGFEHGAELGEYAPEQVIETIEAALEGRVIGAALVEAWALAFLPDAEILEMVASLDRRKALFTNNGPMLNACLDGPLANLRAAFDEIVCSWQLRARKPAPAAFERAAALLRYRPDRLLLLDDSAENVAAATACGWRAEQARSLEDVTSALRLHVVV